MSSTRTKLIPIHKFEGETPLETIKRFMSNNPDYSKTKLGYAGRLDPMAKGLLLLLADEENLHRKNYERLPKTYRFEVLLGVATDSYDILGLITQSKLGPLFSADKLDKTAQTFVGSFNQPYPPYSAPRIRGKPLFWWARENRLNEITIPSKQIEIYNIHFESLSSKSADELQKEIPHRISKVKGTFRQKEILHKWNAFLNENSQNNFQLATLTANCSSGTYIRSISNELGLKLGIPSLAYTIERTSIGEYSLVQ